MEKRCTRMGVDSTINENDFGDELNSKGFVPGCPPTAEALVYGILQLQQKIKRKNVFNRYDAKHW